MLLSVLPLGVLGLLSQKIDLVHSGVISEAKWKKIDPDRESKSLRGGEVKDRRSFTLRNTEPCLPGHE